MIGDGFMLLIAALYLCASVGYVGERNWPMALAVLCYSVANVALVWLSMKLREPL